MGGNTLLLVLLFVHTAFASTNHPKYSKDGYCPFISHIALGRVSPHPDEHGFRRVQEGTVASYVCAHGYEVEGNVNRTCVNGIHGLSWSGSPPRCVARRCPLIESIPNGFAFTGTRFPGSRTVFTCFPSHILEGARFIACRSDWTWDKPIPKCVRACPLTPPVNNGRFNVTYAPIGGVVEIICDRCHNYTVGRFLRCMEDGEFEVPAPNCRPLLCPNPVGRGTGNIIVDYKCGSQACFDCPSGTVASGDANITCLENGVWSGPIPLCVTNNDPNSGGIDPAPDIVLPQIRGGCPLPESLNRGDYSLRLPGLRVGETFSVAGTPEEKSYDLDVILAPLPRGVQRLVPEGTITVYHCSRGYSIQGNTMQACVNGEWMHMGDLPTCSEIMCPLPREPPDALGFYITEGTRYGNKAIFGCYDGYYSNQLPYQIVCQHNGTWNGTAPPTCKPITCGRPIIYDDVILNGRDFTYNGESPKIGCLDTDNSLAEVNRTCLPSGTWDSPLPFSCGNQDNPEVCPNRVNCSFPHIFMLTGSVLSQDINEISVNVSRVLFRRPGSLLARSITVGTALSIRKLRLPPEKTCCNRLDVAESYLFVGQFTYRFAVTNGCQDIYNFDTDSNGNICYKISNGTLAECVPLCNQ